LQNSKRVGISQKLFNQPQNYLYQYFENIQRPGFIDKNLRKSLFIEDFSGLADNIAGLVEYICFYIRIIITFNKFFQYYIYE